MFIVYAERLFLILRVVLCGDNRRNVARVVRVVLCRIAIYSC